MENRLSMWSILTWLVGFCSSSHSRACWTRSAHCALVLSPSFLSRAFQPPFTLTCRQVIDQTLVGVLIHFFPEGPSLRRIPVLPQIQEAPFHEHLISNSVQGKVLQGLQRLRQSSLPGSTISVVGRQMCHSPPLLRRAMTGRGAASKVTEHNGNWCAATLLSLSHLSLANG